VSEWGPRLRHPTGGGNPTGLHPIRQMVSKERWAGEGHRGLNGSRVYTKRGSPERKDNVLDKNKRSIWGGHGEIDGSRPVGLMGGSSRPRPAGSKGFVEKPGPATLGPARRRLQQSRNTRRSARLQGRSLMEPGRGHFKLCAPPKPATWKEHRALNGHRKRKRRQCWKPAARRPHSVSGPPMTEPGRFGRRRMRRTSGSTIHARNNGRPYVINGRK